jgi:hypothetical protein
VRGRLQQIVAGRTSVVGLRRKMHKKKVKKLGVAKERFAVIG